MNLNEDIMLLHQLADGELDADKEREVRAAVAEDPALQAELKEIEAASALARQAFEAPAEDVDFSGFYDGVMARVAEESPEIAGVPVEREEKPGFFQRLSTWFGELVRLERPMAAMGVAAALVAIVGVAAFGNLGSEEAPIDPTLPKGIQGPATPGGGGTVADSKPTRRGIETEAPAGLNAATVESWEADQGRVVVIAADEGDPNEPIVVWHMDEEEEKEAAPDKEESEER